MSKNIYNCLDLVLNCTTSCEANKWNDRVARKSIVSKMLRYWFSPQVKQLMTMHYRKKKVWVLSEVTNCQQQRNFLKMKCLLQLKIDLNILAC